MSALDTTTTPAPIDDWRALRALCYYRWAVALGVSGLFATGRITRLIPDANALLLGLISIGYLLFAIVTTWMIVTRRPTANTQTHLNAGIDLIFLGLLVFSARGVNSGLGMLLITPAAGAATLTSVRLAALLAAVAALELLGGELLRQFYHSPPEPDYTQAGLLGMFMFIACLSANALAQRARRSEAYAARSQLDLENLAQLNEHIIARLGTGVLIVDDNGQIRLANRSARQLLGVMSLLPDSLLADVSLPLSELASQGLHQPGQDQNTQTLELGERRLIVRSVHLQDTQPHAVMLMLEDAAHVDARAQQMKLASLGRLTANIAHEIRNPLSAIHQAQQLLHTSENADEQTRRLLDIIARHSQRINHIVEDVLGLSRREPVSPRLIDLEPFVRELALEYAESIPAPRPQIDFAQLPQTLQIRFDPQHLRRILTNLWDNAREHTLSPVHIQMRGITPHDGRRSYLEVRDNGPGIPAAIADKIFEPFFTTRHGGVGLGLYIVRELCELNAARIKLVSTKEGTSFRILFGDERTWLA